MTNRLLNDQVTEQIREAFQKLQYPVEILFFDRKADCEYCLDTLQIVQEIVELSPLLNLSVHDLDEDKNLAGLYKVDKVPGLVIAGRALEQSMKVHPSTKAALQEDASPTNEIIDYGIRFAGVPFGYEFSSLIQDIIMVSGRDSGLSQETRDYLRTLKQPVLLQVFVTPT